MTYSILRCWKDKNGIEHYQLFASCKLRLVEDEKDHTIIFEDCTIKKIERSRLKHLRP